MFGTAVWINGVFVGEDIACYTSQDYDLTAHLRKGKNELLVRVGRRSTLPSHSAVGNDQERKVFIPGIWGDVRLELSGVPYARVVQVIPDLGRSSAEVRVALSNPSPETVAALARTTVSESTSSLVIGSAQSETISIPARSERKVAFEVPLSEVRLWWPDDPKLYRVNVDIVRDGAEVDRAAVRFGMREFAVRGGDFLLNGRKILLRGGNVAFHRFLSDDQRRTLPWNPEWIRKVLVEIPRAHHFNFLRAHIGQMYNRWYDIADEAGMLIQNEWQFWTASGSKEQIVREFTRWIEDNANHPSIVIWDPLNESTSELVQHEVVPLMKELDPTRPWESVDFTEEHPYIYSLGPVLNDRKFGFSRALRDIEDSERPSVVNEFLWWWIDRDGDPSSLMEGVVERWLGPGWTRDGLLAYQAELGSELVELFRRMGVDAIQPFVYLSNNNGPTAHWFLGDIKDLRPKPILASLKNAFSPVGVSIELWDRHFFTGEKRNPRVFVFNDTREPFAGLLEWGTKDSAGREWSASSVHVEAEAASSCISEREFAFPDIEGAVTLYCRVLSSDGRPVATSQKPGYVFRSTPALKSESTVAFVEGGGKSEARRFLDRSGIRGVGCEALGDEVSSIVVTEGHTHAFSQSPTRDLVQKRIAAGGTLILLEPEFGISDRYSIPLFHDCELTVVWREDADKGGYDSVVIPSDAQHPVWKGLSGDHLRMLNGAFGGEMVSQHDVSVSRSFLVHARSGLSLKTPVLMEIPYGRGRIILSRMQLRGRLERSDEKGLYARRPDPVAQRYLLNLLTTFSRGVSQR